MDQVTETIELDVEEPNELLFKVKVEGADSGPVSVRLVCESGDVSYAFGGSSVGHDDLMQFNVPVMKGRLKEGTYDSRVEVIVDNRFFVPVEFKVNFKKTMRVVAEQVTVRKPTEVKVSASVVHNPAPPKERPVVSLRERTAVKKPAPLARLKEAEEMTEEDVRALARELISVPRRQR